MQSEVVLSFTNPQGRRQQVVVRARRFSIGRESDNDLVINDPGVSRRHAVIELYDGVLQLSDCGSEGGTFVNGRPVRGGTPVKSGDTITLGSACHIGVETRGPRQQPAAAPAYYTAPAGGAQPAPAQRPGFTISPPMIAAAAMAVIVVAAGVLIAVSQMKDERPVRKPPVAEDTTEDPAKPTDGGGGETDPKTEPNADPKPPDSTEAATNEQIERTATRVLRAISTDTQPYIIPGSASGALSDIRQKIERYRTSPALVGALRAFEQRRAELAAQATREGIEPALVVYMALAETDGGQTGRDPVATARTIMPDLVWLKVTFGSGLADSSLIIVAAYRMGVGTKKSHPLLEKMRRVVNNPVTERNVWHLYRRGAISDSDYDFVLRFLALGVIAQNPRQFGIAADPLVF